MKSVIIYDSYFGNTEKIARTIGAKIKEHKKAQTLRVDDVIFEELKDLELLIMGSPTRKFSPTKKIKTILKQLPSSSVNGVKVAAFDTRISPKDTGSKILGFLVKIFGYAAKPITKSLEKKGGNLIIEPEGFLVEGAEGPLKKGELKRAEQWAGLIIDLSKK